MDGFHRSLKVETRVRTPLGVHTVEPQVAARFASLTWGFIVSGDHLVVSGSCHAVQPMMGRGPDIVPRLCPPTGPRFDDYPPARPPVARDGVARASRREPVDRVCLRARPCGRCVGMAAGGRSLATRRCAQRSGVAAPLPGSARTSRQERGARHDDATSELDAGYERLLPVRPRSRTPRRRTRRRYGAALNARPDPPSGLMGRPAAAPAQEAGWGSPWGRCLRRARRRCHRSAGGGRTHAPGRRSASRTRQLVLARSARAG